MKKFTSSLITLTSSLGLLLSGCVHREFDYAQEDLETAYINVVFDWDNAPEADPATMALYLFPTDGGQAVRYDFVGREGGKIRVTAGTYHAVCVNSDQRDVFFRNTDTHHTFEITTSAVSSLSLSHQLKVSPYDVPCAPGTEEQTTMNQPPMLWSASITDYVIDFAPVSKGRSRASYQELHMAPQSIVETYDVTVDNISNAEYLESLSGTISSMADGFFPHSGKPNNTESILSIEMAHNATAATAAGRFLTFGHCPEEQLPHSLMLYAIMTNGRKYYYRFDVSDQAHAPADEQGVHHISVAFLELPNPNQGGSEADDGGGGLQTTVNEWKTENITLTM